MRRACSRCITIATRLSDQSVGSGPTFRVFSSTALRHPRVKDLRALRDVDQPGPSMKWELLEASSEAGPSTPRLSSYPYREVEADDAELGDMVKELEAPTPPPAKTYPPNEEYLGAWSSIGVPPVIAKRLLDTFPHIQAPTPAQRAFILSVFRGRDVYLRDHMGRGKTLAIAVAVATLSYRAADKGRKGVKVVVLLPSTHMVHQVERDLLLLDPSFAHPDHPDLVVEKRDRLFSTLVPEHKPKTPVEEEEVIHEDGKEDEFEDEYAELAKRRNDAIQASKKQQQKAAVKAAKKEKPALILLATPKDLQKELEKRKPTVDVSNVDTIIIDEPDSMLPSLPHRHASPKELAKHTINRHPPPLVNVLNAILNIHPGDQSSSKSKYSTFMDYESRRPVQTVWTSGTLDNALRRLARTRAWVRHKEHLVDLDFTPSASARQIETRESAMIVRGQTGQVRTEPMSSITGVQPEHYALTVDAETGDIDSLQPSSVNVVPSGEPTSFKGTLLPSFIESLALVHTASPPPAGTYALAVPPEGISLDVLSEELGSMGVPSLTLRPETIHDVSALDPRGDQEGDGDLPPILVARRSAVPGLHLPKLHTVYLLGGLDLWGGGRKANENSRVNFYEILAGRVGRLGTEENGVTKRQRIISMVVRNSVDEQGLGELFFGRLSVAPHRKSTFSNPTDTSDMPEADLEKAPGQRDANPAEQALGRRFPLHEWDLERMKHAVLQAYRSS